MSLLLRPMRSAAFFDLDGTLLPGPSLEMRFYRMLRYRGEIGARQMLSWMAEAARLAPRGMFALRHGNKMYLRGVRADAATAFRGMLFPAKSGLGEEAHVSRCGRDKRRRAQYFSAKESNGWPGMRSKDTRWCW